MLKSVGIILFCLQILYGQSSNQISALKVHNDARKEVGVQPLVWAENLEIDAKNMLTIWLLKIFLNIVEV